jgi:hypothetical protein
MARRKTTIAEETTEMTTTTDEPNFDAPELGPDEMAAQAELDAAADADVDTPDFDAEDEVAELVEGEKPAEKEKAKKEPARPPVPEGKVSPVQFAKILSKHLTEKRGEETTVAPQVVYSYIKNNGEGSKNPFPATKSEGRAAVVDAEAALAWWDAKDARVAERKTAAAEKAAKKAEKATEKPAEQVVEAEDAPAAEITESE